jgi:hypothetical protein
MSVTTTNLFPPPIRGALVNKDGTLSDSLQKWLFTLQNLIPLKIVDTTSGPSTEALPPAGLNSSTGQSAQDQEITYKKVSADANVFTITGAAEGPQTLTLQYAGIRFKSDGTNWWVVGVLTP